ncbi:MAG: hypothetical protein ACRCXT_11340 [Paraclostridium sp.]
MELLCIIPYEDLKVGVKYKIIDEYTNEYLVEKGFSYIRVNKKYFEPIVTMEILSDRMKNRRYEYLKETNITHNDGRESIEYARYEMVFSHYDVFVKYEYSAFGIKFIGIVEEVEVKTYEWRVVE